MKECPLDLVFLGLSLSSSWGNGHATTYRALLRGLAGHGHRVLFLERDMPWYASARDLAQPDFCGLEFYHGVEELQSRFGARIAAADAVVVGSYVPDGIAALGMVNRLAGGVRAFYDIDTPITVAALEKNRCAYLAAEQVPLLDLYLSFTGGPLLRHLAQRFGARRPCALYCSVDAARYRPEEQPIRWDLGYLGTYAQDRQATLQRLLIEPARRLPDRRFVVAGPQYPASIDWPANVERIEHLPPSEHVAFYCRQRFTLNVTRADMIRTGWSPSVRLFEAAACGTPIISDRWDGLNALLPHGNSILVAEHADDVVAALHEMDAVLRVRIGENARKIVLNEHTGVARGRELERYIRAVLNSAKTQTSPGPAAIHIARQHWAAPDGAGIGAIEMAGRVRHSRTNRTALVAGGAGFLGSFLCERLIGDGYRVICLDNFRTSTTENLHALRRDLRFSLLAADVCTPLPETIHADRAVQSRLSGLAASLPGGAGPHAHDQRPRCTQSAGCGNKKRRPAATGLDE